MKIAVGGMIASGKSTLVDELANELQIEKIDEFNQEDALFDFLLTEFYKGVEGYDVLLQIYFLNKHFYEHIQFNDKDYVSDRYLIEHWLFANENLAGKPDVLEVYNNTFDEYMKKTRSPDLYVILDLTWDEFIKRIFKRNRLAEIENFEINTNYFKKLIASYTDKLIKQCEKFNVPYIVIPATITNPEKIKIIKKTLNREN